MHFYVPTGTKWQSAGGKDGLHQYSWVIIYEMAFQHALQEAGYTADILVKGDMNYIPEIIPTAAEAEEEDLSP